MTPDEKAELQQAVEEIVQAFDSAHSALMNFSVRLREIGGRETGVSDAMARMIRAARGTPGSFPVRNCLGCEELMEDDGYDYCSESCYEGHWYSGRRAEYQGNWALQPGAPEEDADCPDFCDEHETCRDSARLHTEQRLGFAWTREQQRLREEHLAQRYPEYTVVVERAETVEGSGLRARIPALGLSTWVERDDDPEWYTAPYGWANEVIAVHLQVPPDSFGVLEVCPEDPPKGQVRDQRPVYDDPHANPEDDVIRRITWLEDEPELNTGGYIRTETGGRREIRPQPRPHPQDLGGRSARVVENLFRDGGLTIEEAY